MKKTKSFTELLVWKKAHELVLKIYEETQKFPDEEKFGITSQIRRASVSVPANIAEGYRRSTPKDKARFLNISEGSIDEVKYFLILSKDLGFLSSNKSLVELANEVSKMIYAYKKAILTPKP